MEHFLDIPIYRCSMDKHNIDIELRLNQYLADSGCINDPTNQIYKSIVKRNDEKFKPYPYNQVVGWLRLYRLDSEIIIDHYSIKLKKININFNKKKYERIGQVIHLSFNRNEDSNDILQELIGEIKALKSKEFIKNRFIDIKSLEIFGKYINWYDFLNS